MREDRAFWLDALRGLSALLVLAGHLRSALFVDYSHVSDPGLAWAAFYFVTSLGRESVLTFFVLSGFLVGGAVLRAGHGFDAGRYATARLARLWTVLLPALAGTLVLDQLAVAAAPQFFTSAQPAWNSLPTPDKYSNSFLTLAGNAVFLQTLVVPVFGTNAPLWSLANEFWYYVFFPLAFIVGGGTGAAVRTRVCCAAILAALLMAWSSLLAGAVVWLLGVAAYVAARRRTGYGAGARVLSVVVFIGVLAVVKLPALRAAHPYITDLLVGISAALVCTSTFSAGPGFIPARGVAATRMLSEISYTLYAWHLPIIFVFLALTGAQKGQASATTLALFMACIAGLVLIAWLLWWLAERHTPRARLALERTRLQLLARAPWVKAG